MKIIAIGGFLGAGKTTLLLRLARALRAGGVGRLAIIENEAGKVGIDDQLVREAGLNVKEIFGGCVCCSMGANLLLTLKQMEERYEPEVVIVEASGVASPDMIPRVLEGYDRPLEAVRLVVVFDAERFEAISHVAGPMVEASATSADALVINKVDLVGSEKLIDMVDRLHQLRGGASVVAMSAREGRGFEKLLAALEAVPNGRGDGAGGAGPDAQHGAGHHHDHEHGGDPSAEARRLRLSGAVDGGTFDGLAVVKAVAAAVQRITEAIASEEGAVVGHVKASIAGAGGRAIVRQTSAARGPEVSGELAESPGEAALIVNALAYGMGGERLGGIVDEALGAMAAGVDARVVWVEM